MTSFIPGHAAAQLTAYSVGDDQNTSPVDFVISANAGIVTVTWPQFTCVMSGAFYTIPAGSDDFNAGDVLVPTTYYHYFELVAGVPTAVVSATNPAVNPAVDHYFITTIVRFTSITGAVNVYNARYPANSGCYEAVHYVQEDAIFTIPVWISGIAPSFTTGGAISTSSGYMRYNGSPSIVMNALTEETIMLDDETTVAGLNDITTYSDGSAITAGKYHKVLIGVKRDTGSLLTGRLMIVRQGKPPASEYASLAEAQADAEGLAAIGFGTNYRYDVLPICYCEMLKGDYTDRAVQDLRASGIAGRGGGGGSAISDHGALTGLGDDDHPQYLRTDGTRTLSGDWATGAHAITGPTNVSATVLTSTQATGTAPLTVASTTKVTSLNADQLDGKHNTDFLASDGTTALTADWTVGTKNITSTGAISGNTLVSTVAVGTAPITTTSTTMCTNVNADQLDGLHGTGYLKADGSVTLTGDMLVTATKTIDGVDISAHAANTEAHHATVTLGANTSGILSLSTQAISMATTPTTSQALMGPAIGSATPAAPTFRQPNIQDIARPSGILTLINGDNNNVALTAGVRVYEITGPTTAFTLTGLGNGTDGAVLYLLNNTASTMTISNQNLSSLAANRIISTGAMYNGNGNLVPTHCSVAFFYIAGTVNRWCRIG